MTNRPDKRPISVWVAVGPALIALTMVLRLFDDDAAAPRWLYFLLLFVGLAFVSFVLFQRRRRAEKER